MTRCLITGVNGFLGSHLAEFLLEQGWQVAGVSHRSASNIVGISQRLELFSCDVLDRQEVEAAVAKAQPDVIFHLAAQSLPSVSWQEPEATFKANVFGTLHVLEAVRQAGVDPVVVLASSSAAYGSAAAGDIPISEEKALQPISPYGISKAAADMLGHLYSLVYGVRVIRVRPFLVVGPGKTGDVCSDFARGIVAVEREQQTSLHVGKTDVVRDFLDVQDGVRALALLAEKGGPGEAYNLCSGVPRTVRDVLGIMIAMASRLIPVEQDPSRMRPSDEPVIVGDNSKLCALGWEPRVPLNQALADVLAHWRRAAITNKGTIPR